MTRYTMQRQALGKSSVASCLNRSGFIMATLVRPGDKILVPKVGDERLGICLKVTDALRDEDGSVVLVMEDDSFIEIEPME